MFRSRILPAIFALWGAAIVIRTLLIGAPGAGAYQAGGYAAGIFGVVILALGVRALLKESRGARRGPGRPPTARTPNHPPTQPAEAERPTSFPPPTAAR
ncbi:MAG: hypothetical protein QOE31_2422 [Solirubrobacteraceae bacterium]|jgi:hypothetical protein|nr:hypothetical protein [Solirubrobacteraceae bacterium]